MIIKAATSVLSSLGALVRYKDSLNSIFVRVTLILGHADIGHGGLCLSDIRPVYVPQKGCFGPLDELRRILPPIPVLGS